MNNISPCINGVLIVYRHSVGVKKCFSMSTYLINKSAVYNKLASNSSNTGIEFIYIIFYSYYYFKSKHFFLIGI